MVPWYDGRGVSYRRKWTYDSRASISLPGRSCISARGRECGVVGTAAAVAGSTQAGDTSAVSADGSSLEGTSHDGNAFQAVRWSIGDGPSNTIQTLGAGVLATRGEYLPMEL